MDINKVCLTEVISDGPYHSLFLDLSGSPSTPGWDGTVEYTLGTVEPLDHRGESANISNAEVRDSPAIPARHKVIGDLVVGPDSQKRRAESVVNAEAGNSGSHLFGCFLPVICDHDGLHKHVEFYLAPAFPSLLADVVDCGVESLWFPAGLVALTVLEGATEHRESDDVGMAGRMSESPLAVHTDKQWYLVLAGAKGAHIVEVVVLSVVGHGLAIEEPTQDFDRLGEPGLAD